MDTSNTSPRRKTSRTVHKLPVNVDFLAIGIALALATLIRLGVIHHVSF